MKKHRLRHALLLAVVAAIVVRAVKSFLDELGELSDEVELGYPSANAVPIVGQPGFRDTSGQRLPENWMSEADGESDDAGESE